MFFSRAQQTIFCVVIGTSLAALAACSKTPPAPKTGTPAPASTAVVPGPPGSTPVVPGPPSAAKTAKPAAAASEEALAGEPVTSGEYYDAAVAIESASKQGPDAIAPYFNMESVCDLAIQNLEISDKFRADFKRGFLSTATQNSVGRQIAGEVQAGGSYRLLRVHRRRGQHAAIFRLVTPRGLNYHDLKLAKDGQGKIEVKDLYILLAGETLSATIRRMALPVIANENRNLLDKMLKSESEYVANIGKLQQMNQALLQKNYPLVLSTIEGMPGSMQESKSVLISKMMASAQGAKWDSYRTAADTYRRVYPGDRAVDMLSIDILAVDKKFQEANEAIDRIDKFIGGDPHLNVLRAGVAKQAGKLDEAEQLLLKTAKDPGALPDTYWQLIDLTMKTGQFDKTLEHLVAIEKRYQLQMSDLSTVPEYAPFVAAPQYQQWLNRKK